MFTKLAKGFDELAAVGLIERTPVRFVGGQAAGCAPVATAFASGAADIEPVRTPDTIVRSLAIGNPADGRYSVELARATGGSIEAIPDEATADAIRRVATLEGIYPETAGGVTLAAAEAARRRGVIRRRRRGRRASHRERPEDARRGPVRARRRSPGAGPGRAAGTGPDHPAAVRGVRGVARVMSVVRIPPVLRTSTGGQKQVEVPGTTVREVIGGLVAAYPGLAPQLLAGDGDLNRFVNVFLNDTDVRHLQALDTPVADRDTVLLLPAMAGGADGTWDTATSRRTGTHGGFCSCPERAARR